jgi:hypothetical protein
MAGADRPNAVSSALQTLTDQHVDVMVFVQSSMLLAENRKIAAFALDKRLPNLYGYHRVSEMTIRVTWRANSSDSANSVHTTPTASVYHCPYAVQFWRANALGR